MRCTSSYTRAACASLADSYGPGAPRGATLSGYNIYPAAPELTEAQRQGSLATGLPLCWGHEADTVHIHESELGTHDRLQIVSLSLSLSLSRSGLRSHTEWRCGSGAEDSGRTAMYGAYLADVPALYWETTHAVIRTIIAGNLGCILPTCEQ